MCLPNQRAASVFKLLCGRHRITANLTHKSFLSVPRAKKGGAACSVFFCADLLRTLCLLRLLPRPVRGLPRSVKVLVAEDESKIASFLRKGLEAQGFVVDVSRNGDEAYELARSKPYDALILDIMLPGRDGLSILRNLRERKIALPVILVTARGELNERLEGLNLGADDYITKPFHIEELIARLHAVVRRANGTQQSILSMDLLTRKSPGGAV